MKLQEMRKKIAEQILSGELDFEIDNTGQVMFYSGLYMHEQNDLDFFEEPDPHWDDDFV